MWGSRVDLVEEIFEFGMLLLGSFDFLGMDSVFEFLVMLELLGGEGLGCFGDEVVVVFDVAETVDLVFVGPNFSPDKCSGASLAELVGVGLGFLVAFSRDREDAVLLEEACEGAFEEGYVGDREELGDVSAFSGVGGFLGEDLWHRRGNESLMWDSA